LVGLFTIGGISGVMHSSPPSDLMQTDSYFIVAHFHYVLFGGSIMGLFAGIYYYFPKMTGRMMNETLGKWHFWLTFIGMNLAFFPMHFAGLNGMPRRIWSYDANQGWDFDNHLSTYGAFIIAFATLLFLINFIRSRGHGALAGNNPWDAPTIEWSIPSPPPDYNYATIPTVTSRYPMWPQQGPSPLSPPVPTAGADQPLPTYPSAEQLGIPMPTPTIKPLLATLGLTLAFVGLIWHRQIPIILLGGAIFIVMLYAWVLTPLEPEH